MHDVHHCELASGVRLVTNPEVIRVLAIKRKHLEQIPYLLYPQPRLEAYGVIGRVTIKQMGEHVLARHVETTQLWLVPLELYLKRVPTMNRDAFRQSIPQLFKD